MNNKYIGIFDSGMGGLTVVKRFTESLPDENIIFLGDTAHIPYGMRPKEQITELVLNDVKFLNQFDLKAVVIACNTADSAAREEIEKLYSLPVFGVIRPAAKKAAAATKNNRIGVIATNATVNSGAYEKNIKGFNPSAEIFGVGCPKLVPLIETGHFSKGDKEIEDTLAEYLVPLRERGIDTLVLGCTHYHLLAEIAADMLPDVTVISSSAEAAELLRKELCQSGMQAENGSGGRIEYFVSGDAEQFRSVAKKIIGDPDMKVRHAEI